MINYLEGRILNRKISYIILLVSGVGYKIFINEKIFNNLKESEETGLYIYQRVKEDALDLYGFKTLEDLEFFELLISVSGVGPKSGLNILECLEVNEIKNSIINEDASLLTKVSGIGRKTAERMVLELKNKIGALSEDYVENKSSNEELEALMALGYSFQQAHQALKTVSIDIKDSGEKIRQALKSINN